MLYIIPKFYYRLLKLWFWMISYYVGMDTGKAEMV